MAGESACPTTVRWRKHTFYDTSRYRGKRYSPGYPACPNMADQAGIWKLLRPEEIGLHLTESWMMEPEAAVSAFVFHHPDCAYFTADDGDPESGVEGNA